MKKEQKHTISKTILGLPIQELYSYEEISSIIDDMERRIKALEEKENRHKGVLIIPDKFEIERYGKK